MLKPEHENINTSNKLFNQNVSAVRGALSLMLFGPVQFQHNLVVSGSSTTSGIKCSSLEENRNDGSKTNRSIKRFIEFLKDLQSSFQEELLLQNVNNDNNTNNSKESSII